MDIMPVSLLVKYSSSNKWLLRWLLVGTFNTNRLYRAIGVGPMKLLCKAGEDKHTVNQ